MINQNFGQIQLLQQQVTEHRESKAALQEKHCASERELTELKQQQSIAEQLNNQLQDLKREMHALHSQQNEAPQVSIKIAKLYNEIQKVEAEKMAAQTRVENHLNAAKDQEAELNRLRTDVSVLKLELDKTKSFARELTDGRASFEQDVKSSLSERLKDAQIDADNLATQARRRSENEKKQLRRELELAQENLCRLEHEAGNIDHLDGSSIVEVRE